jgi:threonine aldolase
MAIIDLRSDTVTKPTPEMREAMARAEVGDDVYREDPTVNQLQDLSAQMLGKEAALFVPSGHMGNLAALLAHCGRGDEVILGDLSHPYLSEAGSLAALGGVQAFTLHNQPDGTLKLDEIEAAIREEDVHHPTTRAIALENTHNRCNGVPLSAEYVRSVGELAHRHDLKLHIDGARLFNAAVGLGVPVSKLVEHADSVTFCLSKGLCAPVGSIIAGSQDLIYKTRRIRKQLGGGMRQAGIMAAAGIVSLTKMVDRLAQDHARALRLSEGLAKLAALNVPGSHTNIVRFTLAPGATLDPLALVSSLAGEGILIDYGRTEGFRLVTHYWIDDAAVEQTLSAFSRLAA